MFARDLVESVQLSGDRLDLSVRLNWYRSLPVSCLERLDLRFDGDLVDPVQVNCQLPDIESTLADVVHVEDGEGPWWHVTDSVRLRVVLDPEPVAGSHEVLVTLGNRIPYLVGADGSAVVIIDRARVTVEPATAERVST